MNDVSKLHIACVVNSESYAAGGSLATGRVTHAGQVGGETPDQEEHPGPPEEASISSGKKGLPPRRLPCSKPLRHLSSSHLLAGKISSYLPRIPEGSFELADRSVSTNLSGSVLQLWPSTQFDFPTVWLH
ncbi:hypothetical protein JTE90_017958 [Oedothorax gibbosus]|uniref:Uncharacterized protein n=1 Tax=Oedothorax gibbosus TaxID=931172 RepID=A0AAV6V8L6_9ARAC|nr:hypothetical protein JTE90_017958 [Oedothorax gibbosus]